jgi:hypothetical protein
VSSTEKEVDKKEDWDLSNGTIALLLREEVNWRNTNRLVKVVEEVVVQKG